ncbi:MAG: hypothetical protein A2Y62_16065 [Candidatus Fischerbacteria bacterium RBG_13_37_8]|uniref:Outer membrane protein beta-barrel domain-containing protein n=1 Tax=Candidatus Fischerbacteria bacterium RBG_13_37_8 TaxID=1817863 RepID=A0A1F5VY68_9BACT|nr:MAG: hypothetical protein A2Y62_16065 [Candidatus Fischerbacteria bacterium RBG_13_37_8]
MTDNDIISPIASVEYGRPDRLSFSTQFLHLFPTINTENITQFYVAASISPGIGGIRFKTGIAYVFRDAGWVHVDAVYLHTWWLSSVASSNRNYLGIEARVAIILTFGIGYYWRIGETTDSPSRFFGYHVGYGF